MRTPDSPVGLERRVLLFIVAFAVAPRVLAALYLGNTVVPLPGIFDQVSYHTLANRVLEGHGFSFGTGWWPATGANEPTAHWSYLYVLFLAGIYSLIGSNPLGARLVQAAVVAVLHSVFTYRIASRLFGERAGLVSAGVVSSYSYFIYYAGALLTESLYIVAILWSVDIALRLVDRTADHRSRASELALWLQLGLALAAAILLRQLMLLLVPVFLGWIAWQVRGGWDRGLKPLTHGLAGMLLAVGVIIAAIAPWTARNYRVFDRFVLLNTNAGFALYWGNHPVQGTNFMPLLSEGQSYAELIPEELRSLNEAELDRALLQRALDIVAEDPGRFLLLSISRAKEYLKFWPADGSGRLSNAARVLSFGVCLPFLICGIVLACRRQSRFESDDGRVHGGVWLLLVLSAAYTLIHLATWTLIRYRLPVDALLMPFAGLSIVRSVDYIRRVRPLRAWPRSTGVSA